jgi:hypothetical protein
MFRNEDAGLASAGTQLVLPPSAHPVPQEFRALRLSRTLPRRYIRVDGHERRRAAELGRDAALWWRRDGKHALGGVFVGVRGLSREPVSHKRSIDSMSLRSRVGPDEECAPELTPLEPLQSEREGGRFPCRRRSGDIRPRGGVLARWGDHCSWCPLHATGQLSQRRCVPASTSTPSSPPWINSSTPRRAQGAWRRSRQGVGRRRWPA